jgi:hypothetical protein
MIYASLSFRSRPQNNILFNYTESLFINVSIYMVDLRIFKIHLTAMPATIIRKIQTMDPGSDSVSSIIMIALTVASVSIVPP